MTGRELRRLRERRGLTQVELADALAMDDSSVSKWETGDTAIPKSRVVMLRMVLAEDAA